jgi:histidine triad (HIT) family protein
MALGHALVIPKREEDYFFDLSEGELSGLLPFAKTVARGIEQVVDCKRIGLSVVGLEVPHAHLHLIPLNDIDDMRFNKEPLSVTNQELAELAGAIRSHIT